MKSKITHFWDIINPSNPPGVIWKLADGTCVYGFAEHGKLPESVETTSEPKSFLGYDPDPPHAFGFTFGAWRDVSEWLEVTP